jgi:hypothetical protein
MYEDDDKLSPRKTIGFASAWAAGVTLLCIAIGTGAQQFADSVEPSRPLVAAAPPAKKPVFNAIDYATTGAIKGQTVILSPCER